MQQKFMSAEEWFCVFYNGGIVQTKNDIFKQIISKSIDVEFEYKINDIVSIMLDMDHYIGEIKNKTTKTFIKFKVPTTPNGIAVYLNNAKITVVNQILSRDQYYSIK